MTSVNYQNYYQPQYQHPLPNNYAPSAPPMEEEADCPICLDPLDSDTVVTKCNHLFHNECLKQHINHGVNKNCPMCRSPLSEREITPIRSPAPLEPVYQPKPIVKAKPDVKAEEENDCSICREPVGAKVADTVVTKCHHLFHDGCLKAWLDSSAHKDCPNCRTPLQQRDIKLLTVPTANKPKPQTPPTGAGSTWADTMWSGAKMSGSVLWAGAKGTWWLTGNVAKGLFHGGAFLVKLAASQKPTITEQLAVDANKKLGKLYDLKIKKLEFSLNEQLSKVELSITMADSVYDSSLHSSFVQALKDLAEKVNEQFAFFQIGQKNFYDEGLNVFAEEADRIVTPKVTSRNMYKFNVSSQKAVQLPSRMTDEFVAVRGAIKDAYAKQIQDLKTQLIKQYEETQIELTKVASMKPEKERVARRIVNNLMKKTEEEFTWLMTGVDNFNKEGLQHFNKTVRYL